MKPSRSGVFAVLVAIIVSLAAAATPPSVTFDDEGADVISRPGSKVAWLTVAREQAGAIQRVTSLRGHAAVSPAGRLRVQMKKAATARALWLVVNVDDGHAAQIAPPRYAISHTPVPIAAVEGRSSFSVTAPLAKVLYVRPGVGAWAFSGAEGRTGDADGQENGVIAVSLTALEAIQGNDRPPTTIEPGDVILAIDSRWMRAGRMVVSQ